MPRRKLSEYRSKTLVYEALGLSYIGWGVRAESIIQDIRAVKGFSSYVVKVDQAVKGRFKKGLVALDLPKSKIESTIRSYAKQGYEHFIIEPFVAHENQNERFISIEYDRSGIILNVSENGGVNIESHVDSISTFTINERLDWSELTEKTALTSEQIGSLLNSFQLHHFVFLEINPYVVYGKNINILDVAIEVDDAAAFLVDDWHETDVRHAKNLTKEEKVIQILDEKSVASFNLSVINPQGSIFLLLSGGGASIVVADEIFNKGYGKELANYGEYSGNPSLHETVKYTSQVLELLLASKATKKVLFVGGAVANFTDIAVTFAGVIEAIDAYAKRLKKHNVKVYVRRGGPNQEEGLESMKKALVRHDILGAVHDASTPITDALEEALKGLDR